MATQQEIQQFLVQAGFVPQRDWMPLYYGHSFGWRYQQPVTHEDIARDVLNLTEDYALKLGTFFNTTDGEIIAAAVKAVMPAYYTTEIALLIEGLKLAAHLQQQGRQQLAGPAAVAVLVGVGLIVLLGWLND